MVLTMGLDAKKAELLFRSALIEDASTVNERLAALIAEIDVDDDGEVRIALDNDLWPDVDKPMKVEKLAEMLWLEIIWEGTLGTFPFAWPGLGEFTDDTVEYFRMVLDAYGGQKPD